MKRNFIIFQIGAVLLFLAPIVHAQCDVKWSKKNIVNSYWSEIYSLSDLGTDCYVYVSGNGNEIKIVAEDFNYFGNTFTQLILISDGRQKLERIALSDNEEYRGGGYSIFQEKYLNYTKILPPEVRLKFGGYFGIK